MSPNDGMYIVQSMLLYYYSVVYLIYKRGCRSVTPSVCPSDKDQGLNHWSDRAQTAYTCQVGPGDGFRLGPIPIGC